MRVEEIFLSEFVVLGTDYVEIFLLLLCEIILLLRPNLSLISSDTNACRFARELSIEFVCDGIEYCVLI